MTDKNNFELKWESNHIIGWNLNSLCNFKCVYCFCSTEALSNEHPAVGRYSSKHIAKAFNETGLVWRIHMSGGEPFLYPDYINLCKLLSEKHYISINTNLTTKNVFDFGETINPDKVLSINAGLHVLEREKHKDGVKKYIEKFNFLKNKGFEIRSEYVSYPPLFERMKEDIKLLNKNGVEPVNIKIFRGNFEGKHYPEAYSKDQLEFLRDIMIDTRELKIANNRFDFYGRRCEAGFRSFNMDAAGNLSRCLSTKRSYGNLFTGNYKFDKKARPCPLRYCGCPYEGFRLIKEEKASKAETLIEVLKEKISRKLNKK
ncbi:MAG: radical SAM protein [Candidatus Zixiibacteriota bacterium]